MRNYNLFFFIYLNLLNIMLHSYDYNQNYSKIIVKKNIKLNYLVIINEFTYFMDSEVESVVFKMHR